ARPASGAGGAGAGRRGAPARRTAPRTAAGRRARRRRRRSEPARAHGVRGRSSLRLLGELAQKGAEAGPGVVEMDGDGLRADAQRGGDLLVAGLVQEAEAEDLG